jgi:hypothetical protein
MYVLCDIAIDINGKQRREQMPLNLERAAGGLNEFKKHMLAEAKLSDNQHDKYMLSYHYINYSLEESKLE